jgi:hypothetical protein
MDPHVEEVIITELDLIGDGTPGSPYRRMLQVWSKDGHLIAERDPWCPYAFDRCTQRWKERASEAEVRR